MKSPLSVLARIAAFSLLFTLQSCGYVTRSYLAPTPADFQRVRDAKPFHEDGCSHGPGVINIPLDAAVSMEVRAYQGVFHAQTGYSGTPGMTLFGEVRVPTGNEVRFVTATLTVTDGAGHEHVMRMAGETENDARVSGHLLPAGQVGGERFGYFEFYVPWENFVEPAFTVRMPDMSINGRAVPGKLISFKHVEEKRFATFLEGLCS